MNLSLHIKSIVLDGETKDMKYGCIYILTPLSLHLDSGREVLFLKHW